MDSEAGHPADDEVPLSEFETLTLSKTLKGLFLHRERELLETPFGPPSHGISIPRGRQE